ncbi:hypothetical protein MuYL_2342 [Mucilaginibacter xinganensis]|uniref:Uncharacterized protein n=1 Tax=Mucilaginibacter xinganensis TaxID=1234841 RepID=A0A223NXE3_9SPHI|nr:hypothetical protein MuYL_2342 [Mucilaginibacter xinganensis]
MTGTKLLSLTVANNYYSYLIGKTSNAAAFNTFINSAGVKKA